MRPRRGPARFYNRSSEQETRRLHGGGGALHLRCDDAARHYVCRVRHGIRPRPVATYYLSQGRIPDPRDRQRFHAVDPAIAERHALEIERRKMIDLSIVRITRFAAGLGVIGVLATLATRGLRDAVGFL